MSVPYPIVLVLAGLVLALIPGLSRSSRASRSSTDGTALVIYKLAIAAAGTAAFSIAGALGQFVRVSLGGVAIGILAAALAAWARRRLTVMEAEITLSLLMPFVAYLPAERLGVSGVLAAVTAAVPRTLRRALRDLRAFAEQRGMSAA